MMSDLPSNFFALSVVDKSVNVICVGMGLISIFLILWLNRSLGGKVRSALSWFAGGIAANMVALIYITLFGHMATMGGVSFDVHNLFMTVGMVLFIISAYRFSLLIPRV